MVEAKCEEIRDQLMFYIDNELSEEMRVSIVDHLTNCNECQAYLGAEQDIKSKICKKLKDSYICKCDVNKLAESIKCKIQDIAKH